MIFDYVVAAKYCGFPLPTAIILILVTEILYCWAKLCIVCSIMFDGEQDTLDYITLIFYLVAFFVCCLELISIACTITISKYLRFFLWFYLIYITCDIVFNIGDLVRHKQPQKAYPANGIVLALLVVASLVFTTIVRMYFFVIINSYRLLYDKKPARNPSPCSECCHWKGIVWIIQTNPIRRYLLLASDKTNIYLCSRIQRDFHKLHMYNALYYA